MKVSRPINALICLALILVSLCANLSAQDQFNFEAELNRAAQLTQENKLLDALPILEKLQATKPDHPNVLELLAYSLSALASSEKDAEKRKKAFIRARQMAERAKQLGNNSQ